MGCLCFWSCFFIYASGRLLFFVTGTYSVPGNETDKQALLEFKAGIAPDPFVVMTSWNGTIHFCQWYGVTCGPRHRRVTALLLNSLNLVGTISPSIGNLSFLEVLNLKNNSFTHNIPPELGRLRRLQVLYLYNNSLTGEIPSNISGCSNLIHLRLSNNNLIGKVPVELGYLSKLQYLSILQNNLTGTIPHFLGNLSSFTALSLGFNNFVGNVPDALGQLKNLQYLGISGNKLSGIIPPSIFNLSSITDLDIADNHFEGFIPADLFTTLPNLQNLCFAWNQFTGPIPNSISNASKIVHLQLQQNALTGKVPPLERFNFQVLCISDNRLGNGEVDDLRFLCSLTNSSILRVLDISKNNFGGSLPECIGNLSSNLEMFYLCENHISGSIPASIGNLVNLLLLIVEKNNLSGMIPQAIGNLQNVVVISFGGNKFFGPIPPSLGNLTRLSKLYFSYNDLQGTIPPSLGNCTSLQVLQFLANNLSGTLPPQVIGLSSLSIYAGFAKNYFTGSLPTEVGNLKALGILDVSDNLLSGEIPKSLGSCTSLEYLYMNRNRFQGSIPFSLSSLRGLQKLDFSHNNLSGQIPGFLASFNSLVSLNLSFNDFEGIVPTDGVFKNASISSVVGNSKLCGGIPEFQLPICHVKRSNKRRLKVIIATIAGIPGAILVLLSFVFLLWFKKRRQNPISSSSEVLLLEVPKVSFNDLHKATDGFSLANLIGSGSFGFVYKGILTEGRQTVAVKLLNLQYHGAAKSFMAECEALRNIRHRNLVKIITACSGVDDRGNDFMALVYEFMVNGSLEKWLHPSLVAVNGMQERYMFSNLIQRINIAIDVAFAIEYLHHHSGTPIVHCDLKPSNVLLDDEMTAHIGDFGLAKFVSHSIQNNFSNQSSSAGLRGTIGYAPPEYGLGSEVSTQGDVYSYGILLLEMFTRKRPTADMFKEGLNLHKFVESALPNEVSAIADPFLFQEGGQSNERTMIECLISILGIGVSCSAELSTERMDISDAAMELCLIRDKLKDSQGRNSSSSNFSHA